ncbi:MAG: cytochrome b/b6 domain-containing protein [Deltaproteobacteria bacterium]|nr:MAG: cytochrome b/b6 domain-containing protein [Deltaproteobacteria bacterium]
MSSREKELIDLLVKEAEDEFLRTAGDLPPEELERIRQKVRERARAEAEREVRRLLRKREEEEKRERERVEEEEEYFIRFNRNFRFQHMVLFTSVIILIITGLPLKFPDFALSRWLMSLWGGVKYSTVIHRIGATMLIYFMVHHLLYTLLSRDGRRDFIMLIPTPKDFRDFFQNIRYFVGKTEDPPKFDRFSYIEKFDYWAVYWGCVIMIGSGLILWFEETAMKFLPKFWVDMAHEAHSDEALLATLAIVIWHFYNVHFNPDRFPGTLLWWHGKISKEEMLKEHPLEYERIMAERARRKEAGEEGRQ